MTEKIDVSFVMSVYNKEYYLPAVLKALLNQTGVKNPEYIFVDDMSKDSSVEIIILPLLSSYQKLTTKLPE